MQFEIPYAHPLIFFFFFFGISSSSFVKFFIILLLFLFRDSSCLSQRKLTPKLNIAPFFLSSSCQPPTAYLNFFLPSLTFQCLIYLTLHLVYNILSESALKTVETFPIFGPFSILSEVSIILPTANSCPQKTTKCKLAGQPYRYRTHLY